MTRQRLQELTDRWRGRHDLRRPSAHARPPADPERERLASRAFPYRTMTPEAYVADHGDAMPGFTYDEARYADAALDAWLLEVGRLLRERRSR
ncbi:MAG: hypothetical protein ACXWWQ_04235 [Candidatus Limnocylindria bacterium]